MNCFFQIINFFMDGIMDGILLPYLPGSPITIYLAGKVKGSINDSSRMLIVSKSNTMKIRSLATLKQDILFVRDKDFGSILRRFFINTLFDSTFMQIGIIVGSAFAANQDLHLIMRTLVASSIALGISTGVSTYESEKLERMIKIAELEKAMFRKLDKTVISERDRTSTFIISVINFLTPIFCCFVIVIPLLLSELGFFNITVSSLISISFAMGILFMTGTYLGKLGNEKPVMKGLRMVFFGSLAFIIGFIIQKLI